MSWPNLFTILRLLLTPILTIFLINQRLDLATGIFFIAGITDALDGFLARRLNQKSNLGACLDPIADKVLLSTSFVLLSWYHHIPYWLAVVVLSRDVFILMGALLLFLFNVRFEVKPSLLGKATTLSQIVTVMAVLINTQFQIPPFFLPLLFIFTLFLTIGSGLQYTYKAYKMFR
ncbi:MAG: CDP-diacylglycerol--glycerol-3-phosphate 3-phosphatidyltransferase [Candidatus Desulfofervidaceae bacterium]|nr:CDP-diacylglycerol--glycerol-3-phosphate 3-phosphatidyltransferase [Candidatus Desulfofervidaceae bacterium]MDL1970572.1 CDP-diacylglycerol--glycerol-3-phosphate 3-phosphatidyltransferase [Candidatus Desulfofervidaceae bacterium]